MRKVLKSTFARYRTAEGARKSAAKVV